ncbi:MAG: NAD(P)-dependent dehydrogenase (short-subunit alcohol dehydrogenase family) [Granulosicoccus sp.]|jgi:NAD(P)-dependent dehydrogenase (short-subunit alcohol dehydrogenase family)
MGRLTGKVAVITGGAGAIGSAAAGIFANEGAKVVLVDIDEPALKRAIASIDSDDVTYVVADVTQAKDVEHYVQVTAERFGGIDIFLNNAGVEGHSDLISEYDIDTFDQVIAVNVRGVWLGLKYVIPEMEKRGGGSIVISSSVAGVGGYAGLSPYVASKHAVVGLMRSAALECAPQGIRVNTVNPSAVESRMMRSLEEQIAPGAADAVKAALTELIPLKRYAQPEDVVQLMLFLASDESKFCTGSVYMVDGGTSTAP